MARIMIDPGHTAWNVNPGAVPGYYEGTMVWKLANFLIPELRSFGFEVGCTKKQVNDPIDVVPRGRMAQGYDLFVSLHSDACGTESVDRVTVFHMVNDDWSGVDEKSKALAEALAPEIAETIGTHDAPQIKSKAASGDRNGNGRHDDNWLGVLYGAHSVGVPGVLVEHSFHTNKRSAAWLMDDDHLKQLARVEAMVIAEYFGVNIKDGFLDVPENAWYNESVKWAVNEGIVTGVDKRHFAPDKACTRGQTMTMLWRMFGSPEPMGQYRSFDDIKPADYFAKAVQWALQAGITTGTSSNTFSPNKPCTRAQAVTFLWRAFGSPVVNSNEFDDVSKDDYFCIAVNWAFDHGITKGVYPRHFSPNDPCTRAQIVTMMRKAKEG